MADNVTGGVMYTGGASLHRLRSIENCWKKVIFDFNQAQGFLSSILVHGGYSSYMVASVVNFAYCQYFLILYIRTNFDMRSFGSRNYSFYSRQLPGSGSIYVENPGV